MGATLPMLVAHLVASTGNVGQSGGPVVFYQYSGSAAACFVGDFFLFSALGMNGSVWVASAINILVAITILVAFVTRRIVVGLQRTSTHETCLCLCFGGPERLYRSVL